MIETPSGGAYDVAIIGGGVIGLSCAYALTEARPERRIVVIDAQTGSREASWAAGGMLAPYSEFSSDSPLFRLCRASADLYPTFVERLRAETGLPCALVETGSLLVQLSDDDAEPLDRQAAFAAGLGVEHEILDAAAARRVEPGLSPHVQRALWLPERSVNNRQLWDALAAACRKRGVAFLLETPVEAFARQGGVLTGVVTPHGRVGAETVILAAGAWSQPLGALLDLNLPVAPIKGQLLRFDVPDGAVRHTLHRGGRYLVPRPGHGLVVGATSEDRGFDWSVEGTVIADLARDAVALVPSLEGMRPVETWAGLRPKLPDGMPVLGGVPHIANLVLATGHYRNGILLTPITGQLVADIIDGRARPEIGAFAASRFA